MQYSSLQTAWGIIAIIAAFAVFTVSIVASLILHSRKIRKSEEKFRTLFTRVFDALLLVDKDGLIVDLNESGRELIGAGEQDKLHAILNIKELIDPVRLPDLDDGFRQALDGRSVYLGEVRLPLRSTGTAVLAEMGCTGLEILGQTYVLASLRDITWRRQAESELRDKNIALKNLLGALEEEKSRLKRQISNTVENEIMPSLGKLVNEDGKVNPAYFKSIRKNLMEIAALSGYRGDAMMKLSPREIEIGRLTQNGSTAKEIAKALNITVATVEKHKERIRKKLRISKSKINLATHLKKLSRKASD